MKLNFQCEGHLYATCLFYILSLCPKCLLSQFLSRGIRMHISFLTGLQKGHISGLKNSHILRKKLLLKLNFQCEGHLDAYFLIYILTFYYECVLFQLFSCGIRMHISILTGVQKGHTSRYKNSHNLLKNVLLKLNLQDEGHLYANSLFYILNIYCT